MGIGSLVVQSFATRNTGIVHNCWFFRNDMYLLHHKFGTRLILFIYQFKITWAGGGVVGIFRPPKLRNDSLLLLSDYAFLHLPIARIYQPTRLCVYFFWFYTILMSSYRSKYSIIGTDWTVVFFCFDDWQYPWFNSFYFGAAFVIINVRFCPYFPAIVSVIQQTSIDDSPPHVWFGEWDQAPIEWSELQVPGYVKKSS